MNQLVNNKIDNTANFRVDEKGNVWVSSLYIEEVTEKRHDNILADIRNIIAQDYSYFRLLNFQESTVSRLCGIFYKEQPMFWLSEDGSSVLLGGYSISHRIKVQKELRQYKEQQNKPLLPQTYKEALLALVAAEEEKEKLIADNFSKALQIEEQAPKVELYNTFIESKDYLTIEDFAKSVLSRIKKPLGQKKMFAKLRERKALTYNNRPMQSMIDKGYMTEKVTPYTDYYGEEGHSYQPLITPKGAEYIFKKLVEFGDVELIDIKKEVTLL